MDEYVTIPGYGQVPSSVFTQAAKDQGFKLNSANTGNFDLGWNAPTLKMGLSGIGTLGNLWGAWQSNRLARDQLNFTKDVTNTNLNNQIQSYNTALEDRARARGAMEGQTTAETQSYIDKNRLNR